MKVQEYRALNEDGRVMYSRFDSFYSIGAAVYAACLANTYMINDGEYIAAASFVEVIDMDGYPRRYKITNPDTRRLRWRKV